MCFFLIVILKQLFIFLSDEQLFTGSLYVVWMDLLDLKIIALEVSDLKTMEINGKEAKASFLISDTIQMKAYEKLISRNISSSRVTRAHVRGEKYFYVRHRRN